MLLVPSGKAFLAPPVPPARFVPGGLVMLMALRRISAAIVALAYRQWPANSR